MCLPSLFDYVFGSPLRMGNALRSSRPKLPIIAHKKWNPINSFAKNYRGLGGSNPAWLPGTRHALWANGPYSTQRPHPLVEGGRPRCRDGTLLCPAQLPGAPHTLAANGLIG